tara:strand:+ start:391 stop:765 length:375 start_codon:yes stop_codon:yes gene_type:complete
MADKYGIENMDWMKKKRFIESKVNQLKEGGKNMAKETARRAGVETFKATQKIGKLAQDPKVDRAKQISGEYWNKVQEGGKNAKTLLTKELKTKARGMAGQLKGGGGKRILKMKNPWQLIKRILD